MAADHCSGFSAFAASSMSLDSSQQKDELRRQRFDLTHH